MSRSAVARSTRCTPSRRLILVRVVRIEGGAADAIQVAGSRAREEGGGRRGPTSWVESDRARLVWSSPVGFGTLQLGPGGKFGNNQWRKSHKSKINSINSFWALKNNKK
jgi:hypothetical protein